MIDLRQGAAQLDDLNDGDDLAAEGAAVPENDVHIAIAIDVRVVAVRSPGERPPRRLLALFAGTLGPRRLPVRVSRSSYFLGAAGLKTNYLLTSAIAACWGLITELAECRISISPLGRTPHTPALDNRQSGVSVCLLLGRSHQRNPR